MTEEVEELKQEVEELREELRKVKNNRKGEQKDKETEEIKDQEGDAVESSSVSRRDFLKALGGGTAAAGAMAMLPSASAFTFKDDKSFKFGNLSSSNTNFEVGKQGDLDLYGNDIVDAGKLNAENVNNEVYASEFDGPGLATKVENALSWLNNKTSGQGRVRVTPKDDGTAWTWDKRITIDGAALGGAEIVVDDTVKIEYGGTDWFIIFENSNATPEDNLRIVGGKWIATGDAAGWLKIKDMVGGHVAPRYVDTRTASDDAIAISFENHEAYTELNVVEGRYDTDNGIDFKPASITGGSGTDSFQGTSLRDVTISKLAPGGFGIRLRGNMRYSSIRRPNIFPQADDATAIFLDTSDALGMEISAFQAEGNNSTGSSAVRVGSNYNNSRSPLFVSPHTDFIDNAFDPNGTGKLDEPPAITADAKKVKLTGLGTSTAFTFDPFSGAVSIPGNFSSDGVLTVPQTSASNPGVQFGSNGAGIYVDGNGELVAVDENGNETTIS